LRTYFGSPASGTTFGIANRSRAACWAEAALPPEPYFLISTLTFCDGKAPTPNQ
jgi:hypothetical protein